MVVNLCALVCRRCLLDFSSQVEKYTWYDFVVAPFQQQERVSPCLRYSRTAVHRSQRYRRTTRTTVVSLHCVFIPHTNANAADKVPSRSFLPQIETTHYLPQTL